MQQETENGNWHCSLEGGGHLLAFSFQLDYKFLWQIQHKARDFDL